MHYISVRKTVVTLKFTWPPVDGHANCSVVIESSRQAVGRQPKRLAEDGTVFRRPPVPLTEPQFPEWLNKQSLFPGTLGIVAPRPM